MPVRHITDASQQDHAHEHTHREEHAHSHERTTTGENYSARKHPEFVVMDIGVGLGGLIIHTDPDLHGEEIEISPAGNDDQRSHKDVLERSINGRAAFTAVFDGLGAGHYTLWNRDHAREREVAITGGRVTELDWRTTT
jgi:hypothetical protein